MNDLVDYEELVIVTFKYTLDQSIGTEHKAPLGPSTE